MYIDIYGIWAEYAAWRYGLSCFIRGLGIGFRSFSEPALKNPSKESMGVILCKFPRGDFKEYTGIISGS